MKAHKEITPSASPSMLAYRTKRIAELLNDAREQLSGVDCKLAPTEFEELSSMIVATEFALASLIEKLPSQKKRGEKKGIYIASEDGLVGING